ncbi:MAG: serine/threonine protein kinase, partial [Myxococcaceae bacterium]|nr:serine/threonine protein kinase [Myxococcaceae bacterium]
MSDVAQSVGGTPLPVELQGGYRALRAIAQTRLFTVLLVESVERGHKLVWKVLRPEAATDPEALGRFIDEAGLVQGLMHPNLVRSLGAGRMPDGAYYLATELLEGETLKERLARAGVLTPDELVRLMGPVCDALHYVHGRQVFHRDLRPEKIFITKDGTPRVLDFGLAHFGGTRSVTTSPGVLLTRPQYTPPECIMGHRSDPLGDVYALGVTMYEALTGRPPFDGPDGEVLSQQLTGTVPLLPPIAAHLQPIIDRCLAKEPSRRFDAKDLKLALEQFGVLPASKVDPDQVIALTAMLNGVSQGDTLGSYRIEKMLGDGGMGQVFKARHLKLDREVAIKLLKPQQAQSEALVERFFREARAVNRIKHEHIIEIHDFVEEKNEHGIRRSYCVMELLNGASLLGLMAQGPLSIGRAVKLVRQAASALQAAHEVGITHRDVKPDNLFVTTRSGAEFVK